MDYNTILLFIISSISLTLLPGPDILFVITTSISEGWKNGSKISLGLCSGLVIHTLFIMFGLGIFFEIYPHWIRIIEISGAAYLIYLAYSLNKASNNKQKEVSANLKKRFFLTGFIMNISNPKVSLFFIGFFPGFIFSNDLSYNLQFLILGGIFIIQALIIFLIISILSDKLGKRILSHTKQPFWKKIQGVVLVFIALVLLYP